MIISHHTHATTNRHRNDRNHGHHRAPAGRLGSSSSSASTAANGVSLGGTDFLTLMLAQLKNQDPDQPGRQQ
jgi:flagellar hook assembly protein FlgD